MVLLYKTASLNKKEQKWERQRNDVDKCIRKNDEYTMNQRKR